ncbi:microtubule-associated protein 1A-like isoform X1 [Apteryx mantelli]|uniref:Microtubule-associated protein 1A-like isoform X1 n=1 Tax=Apteryx mantelli TaxID=2696672 RepID=A0ABM4FEZ6_9AVES
MSPEACGPALRDRAPHDRPRHSGARPPSAVALRRGPPGGAEPPAPAPPQILVTDFSAASCLEGPLAPGGTQQEAAEPGEEDGEQVAKEAPEDGSSSVGSSPVALDPVEKEWLQGAASGDLPVLSQLLQQEPSLATKKVSGGRGDGAPAPAGCSRAIGSVPGADLRVLPSAPPSPQDFTSVSAGP